MSIDIEGDGAAGSLGRWVTGPLGRWAAGSPGRWVTTFSTASPWPICGTRGR